MITSIDHWQSGWQWLMSYVEYYWSYVECYWLGFRVSYVEYYWVLVRCLALVSRRRIYLGAREWPAGTRDWPNESVGGHRLRLFHWLHRLIPYHVRHSAFHSLFHKSSVVPALLLWEPCIRLAVAFCASHCGSEPGVRPVRSALLSSWSDLTPNGARQCTF